MPHISKQKLKEEALLRLHKRFTECFVKLRSTTDVGQFLDELFTDTERLMFAKRLAIICLLCESVSTYRIAHTLKVSVSTVVSMKRKWQDHQYDFIESLYKKKAYHVEFWDDIDKLLRLGLPPRGKGRWKWLYELEEKRR